MMALFQVESIIKALGIDTKEGMEQLVAHFVNEDSEELRLVDPSHAVKCLRNFVDEFRDSGGPTAAAAAGQAANSKTAATRREERQFWERMSNVIARRTHRLWKNLYDCMQKTHNTLEDRKRTIDTNGTLETQNKELRALLSQYMSARVNDELYVPPAQMLQLQQG